MKKYIMTIAALVASSIMFDIYSGCRTCNGWSKLDPVCWAERAKCQAAEAAAAKAKEIATKTADALAKAKEAMAQAEAKAREAAAQAQAQIAAAKAKIAELANKAKTLATDGAKKLNEGADKLATAPDELAKSTAELQTVPGKLNDANKLITEKLEAVKKQLQVVQDQQKALGLPETDKKIKTLGKTFKADLLSALSDTENALTALVDPSTGILIKLQATIQSNATQTTANLQKFDAQVTELKNKINNGASPCSGSLPNRMKNASDGLTKGTVTIDSVTSKIDDITSKINLN